MTLHHTLYRTTEDMMAMEGRRQSKLQCRDMGPNRNLAGLS
jgi:hypothetical protein